MSTELTHEQITGGGKPVFFDFDEHDHPEGGSTMLGFWMYLMSDCLIFAVLFACYGVLGHGYGGGKGPKELFELPLVAFNTAMLLFSSLTYGIAMLTMEKGSVRQVQFWLVVTGLFGLTFLGVGLLHAGRHARLSRHLRLDLADHARHPDRDAWPWPGQSPPPAVPQHVLALPRRHLDRRLHLCLFAGNAAMSRDSIPEQGPRPAALQGHGTRQSYLVGFGLSALLTAIPFWLVMSNALGNPGATAAVIVLCAVMQILVHTICFLHVNTQAESGWTLIAYLFTGVILLITICGSLWIMYHLNANMMPGMAAAQMSNTP